MKSSWEWNTMPLDPIVFKMKTTTTTNGWNIKNIGNNHNLGTDINNVYYKVMCPETYNTEDSNLNNVLSNI